MSAAAEQTPGGEPNDQELTSVIDRLREISREAWDHLLLGDGPPHPDHELLASCAEALEAQKRERASRDWPFDFATRETYHAEKYKLERAVMTKLRKAKSLKATTPAGIFAKAMAVRYSKTGAAMLAMSLAEELIGIPGLRASLWPAEADNSLAGMQ